jgi:hypothetical protein
MSQAQRQSAKNDLQGAAGTAPLRGRLLAGRRLSRPFSFGGFPPPPLLLSCEAGC